MKKILILSILALSYGGCAWNYVTPPPEEVTPVDPNPPGNIDQKPVDWTDGVYKVKLNGVDYEIFVEGNEFSVNGTDILDIAWRNLNGTLYFAGTMGGPTKYFGLRYNLKAAIRISGVLYTGTATRVSSSN